MSLNYALGNRKNPKATQSVKIKAKGRANKHGRYNNSILNNS